MRRLDGKVALITGAARGMGAATARLFAAEGAKVGIADVLDAEGKALATELGDSAFYFHLDVTDETGWRNFVAEAKRRYGGIDVLVNNAAVFTPSTIVDCEPAEFKRILNVNIFGVFLGIKTVAPVMIEKKKGSIVNIASTAALWGFSDMGAYGTSKWGARGLSKMAAMELGPLGVRVNTVCPGGVNTSMANPKNLPESELNKGHRMQPIQRIGQPREVAHASLFLASDDSSYVCGAEVAVDGGQTVGLYTVMPGR